MQRTLTELKRLGDKAFAEAQDAIDTARQLACECRQLNAELRRSKEEFLQVPPPASPGVIAPAQAT